MTKCCVVGLGYIGLPTAVLLAKNGHDVIGFDIDPRKIEILKEGSVYIKEPNLDFLIKEVIKSKKFKPSKKICKADIFIIAVPTPFLKNGSEVPEPDLSYVENAAISISEYLEIGNTVIIESTIPIGTTKKISELIISKTNFNLDEINFAHCPERVLPGKIIEEMIINNRIVGGLNTKASEFVKSFYKTFCKGEIIISDSDTAEMVKLSENAFRDVNIAFANELSILCEKFSINTNELINLANKHPRVNILQPGCGVGGHCIAVDPWFLVSSDKQNTNLIQSARKVNIYKTKWVTSKISKKINEMETRYERKIKVGCFGITFKPDIDDLRESPALKITNNLCSLGYDVYVCDPNIDKYKKLKFLSLNDIVQLCDLLIILVAHKEFKNLKIFDKKTINLCGIEFDT